MADEPKQTSEYRARPLPENQTTVERLQTIQPEQRVVVEAQHVLKSLTVQINGVLFIVASIVSIMDIVMGANIIEPIVRVFTNDPNRVTLILTTITQIYTVLNIILRLRTTSPVTLRRDPKE